MGRGRGSGSGLGRGPHAALLRVCRYGDVSFETVDGRAVATVWLLVSTLVTAAAVGTLAAYRAESKQHALVAHKVCRRFTMQDMLGADLDEDGDVGEFEFVVFKLIETEMVDPVFLQQIRAQFHTSGASGMAAMARGLPRSVSQQ
jgi:hypothetical protein